MSNVLIVESANDKFFIEAVIKEMNIDIEIGEPICSIDEYECLGGISKLEERLRGLTHRIIKGEIEKVGIIFDADKIGIKKRTEQIQEKIYLVINELELENRTAIFDSYIQNKDGKGELEDILKEIKTKPSLYADCLSSWRECLSKNDEHITDKIFNKFWINNYIMYDTCSNAKHRGDKGKYCIFEYAMKEKKIWNFDHTILNNLKKFLKEIGEKNDNITSN